ncbi:hypothetical protein PSEUBRA_000819 [Kalmanozyma brasiliensis GHG001]|uniref:Uncharacterized protein n=1 Tax=Kalmanozyma brasiliensis (strain GHG001) TaxID=1365824 RepID=V5EVT9_KALBG|nr:uncharacterized protein PSEUBRA_000819 [Kalmanozyma brasiliensis GHG001]EST09600.1 hypothetical protein PSEUBRA_000819 [Kalmanozyma brasiliensis GHG001]
MAGSGVEPGPHTGSGTEATNADLSAPQRASVLSNLDFSEIAKIQLPPASGIADYAIFDRDDARAVHGSQPSFTKSFEPERIRELIDVFVQATAPSVSASELKESTREIELAGKTFTISGPRGAQYPLEIATLHAKDGGEVYFVAPTATLLLLFQTAPGADVQYQSNEKQGVWTAVRSFAFALSEKGL